MSRSSPTIYLGVFHVNNCICYLSSTSSSQCTRFPSIGHVTTLARPHIFFNNSSRRNTCIICLIHDITNLIMVMLDVIMHCIDNQSRNFSCLIHNLVIPSIIPLVICTKTEKMMNRTPPPLKLAGRQGKMFDLYLVNQQAATKKQSDDHHNIVPCQQFPKY